MRPISRFAGLWPLVFAAACVVEKTAVTPGTPPPGTDSFVSAAPGGNNGQAGAGATEKSATDSAARGGGTPRAVEEGDVFKVVGDTLYVLNMYRGLQVIDLTDADHPVKLGTAPVLGQPVEMYVRNGFAYLVVSDFFAWQTIDGVARPFRGSQVKVVDVRDAAHPVVVGSVDFDGAVSDTRIVGDVLYVVANRWAWYGTPDGGATDDLVVRSIDLSTPAAPVLKQSLVFSGNSNVIHVSPTTLYVASTSYTDWQKPKTTVRVVDIDDPQGAIAERTALEVDGSVENRFQLDEFDGMLRVVSHAGSWGQDGSQLLSVFGLSPAPQLVGRLALDNTGGLFATRFDGDRAYLVTMVSVDPLEVIDLRDPANPVLTHSLVIPGVLQQLAPRGDRLLALGTDDRWSGLAASLFDVADPQKPSLLARVAVGQGQSWSTAQWDDKAFRVVDEQNLMLVPFSGWSEQVVDGGKVGSYTNGFQILSFDLAATDKTALTARGIVTQEGTVSRAFAHEDRLVSLSDRRLQTVDATDLDEPKTTGSLELARDVSDFAIAAGHAVTLSTPGWSWTSQETEVRVTALADPEGDVLGRLALPFYAQRLLADGDRLVVLGWPTTWDGSSAVAVVDLTNPAAPALLRKPDLLGRPYDQTRSESLYLQSARIVAGKLVVPSWTSTADASGQWSTTSSLVVLDLATGDSGRLALPGAMAGDLVADGSALWASHSESAGQGGAQPLAKFFADRLDVSDATNPAIAASVNVPGTLVGASGATLFTRDYRWTSDGHVEHALAELTVSGAKAVLRSYLPVDDGLGRIVVDGRRLYATTQPWWWSNTTSNGVSLMTYASTDTAGLSEVSRVEVNDWVQLREVAGGHLFLGNGYWGGPWEYGVYGPMARGGAVADGVAGRGVSDVGWYAPASGLVDFSLAEPDHPSFRQSLRTNGWVQGLAVDGGMLYLSSGIYGLQRATLTP